MAGYGSRMVLSEGKVAGKTGEEDREGCAGEGRKS